MKTDPLITKYLKGKGWEYREDPNQYNLKTCPYCGNSEYKFYVNKKTGQNICFKSSCNASGGQSLYKLKTDLGDISPVAPITSQDQTITPERIDELENNFKTYHNALLRDRKSLVILREKYGFTLKTIRQYKLGLHRKEGKKWLVIPYYKDKKPINAKFRTLPPHKKTFRRINGLESGIFNIDNINIEQPLFVCESETDCLSMIQNRTSNTVAVSVGASGFKPEWIDFFDQFDKVYLVYDNDLAGQEGAKKAAKRIGLNRTYNILLPGDGKNKIDATDYFKSGGTNEKFNTLIKEARMFDINDIVNLRSVMDAVEADLIFNRDLDTTGLHTPWENLNKLTGNFLPGDLVVISGNAKIGKTTLALNLLLSYAKNGIPSMYYCLEMRPERMAHKVISYFRCVERNEITREDVIYIKSRYGSIPFYMAHSYDFTVDHVLDTIREGHRRYGFEAIAFDHLHFLVRNINNVSAEVSVVVRYFKMLAEELRIPIFLICQPRKINTARRATFNDLRDSSSIGQDADTVMIVHRERLQEDQKKMGSLSGETQLYSNEAEVIVDATRYNPGGIAKLYYEGAWSRYFTNIQEKRKYGKDPV